jgi:hypothetical protein
MNSEREAGMRNLLKVFLLSLASPSSVAQEKRAMATDAGDEGDKENPAVILASLNARLHL